MFSVQDPNCLAEPSMKRVILSDQANNIYAEGTILFLLWITIKSL